MRKKKKKKKTRIEEIDEQTQPGKDGNDGDSDASSELRLSYVDDIPLKQRFPSLKPPTTSVLAPNLRPDKKMLNLVISQLIVGVHY